MKIEYKYYIMAVALIVIGYVNFLFDWKLDINASEKREQSYSVMTALKVDLDNARYDNTELISQLNEAMQYPEIEKTYCNPVLAEDFTRPTSPFGIRDVPDEIYTGGSRTREHNGIDMAGVWHARIVAVANGIVLEHYLPPGWYNRKWYNGHDIYGGLLSIQHDDGRVSRYAHLSRTYVREGQRVEAGVVIGRMGTTGLSTGEHLHFELIENGEYLQPLKYIDIR